MICQALGPLVSNTAPEAIGTDGVMLFIFETEHTPADVTKVLDEMQIEGFFLTNVLYTDTDSVVEQMMKMHNSHDRVDVPTAPLTLEEQLQQAIADEDFEKAAKIRDEINNNEK
jgi:excinuclease UvrABC helicase subunit UvrB